MIEKKEKGVLPLALKQLFDNKGSSVIEISYFEVYNENIYDLLNSE